MTAEADKATDKEGGSEKDKEQPMDVDKKPCEDSAASTQSTTDRTTEEPERVVKVKLIVHIVFLFNFWFLSVT